MARAGGRKRLPAGGPQGEGSDYFVRALARGLRILALFDVEHPAWSLGDICEQTGMSKTTAYRMLRTLEAEEFLAYDPKSERYHLGRATIPGAYLALSYVGFVRAVHPLLEELAEATGETVELTVAGLGGAIVVDEVATAHPFRLNRPTGRILNSLSNSSFRLHVAFLPAAEQRRIIETERMRLPGHTDTGGTGTEGVLRRLAQERAEGLAWDLEEQDRGVCAVSAPVYERDGTLRAVLSVVAPAERFGPQERSKAAHDLKETAARMTGYLSEGAAGSTSG